MFNLIHLISTIDTHILIDDDDDDSRGVCYNMMIIICDNLLNVDS